MKYQWFLLDFLVELEFFLLFLVDFESKTVVLCIGSLFDLIGEVFFFFCY